MRRVVAIGEDEDGPSMRLRVAAFAPWAAAAGAELTWVGMPRSLRSRGALFRRCRDADVVLVQRRLLPPWQVRHLRRCARRLVYDVDDAVHRRDHAPFDSFTRRRRVRAWLQWADVVIVGSRELAREVQGRETVVVPTTVSAWAAPPKSRSGGVVWLGQPITTPYLTEWLEPVVQRGLPVRAVGADRRLLPAAVEVLPWSPEAEKQALAWGRVGLAPLPDNPWTRGKCASRLLHYLAADLPAVASGVGAQGEVASRCAGVERAESPAEMMRALDRQFEAPFAPGEVAASVAGDYGTERWAATWWAAVLGSPPPPSPWDG